MIRPEFRARAVLFVGGLVGALVAGGPAAAACINPANKNFFSDQERAALQMAVQAADCALDPEQASNWAEGGSFRIGNLPEVKGRDAIRSFLRGFFGQGLFTELSHRVISLVETKDATVFQAVATYRLKDGKTVDIPYANWVTYTRENGALKFNTYRVYIDPAPLFGGGK